jgi:hypothetical protein
MLSMDGCGCQQSNYSELDSPDGRYVIVEREENCGATDPFSAAISIQARHPRLGISWLDFPSKRVFLADVSHLDTRIRWLSNHDLEIVCTGCEKYGIAERADAWRDVKVHFDVGKAKMGEY